MARLETLKRNLRPGRVYRRAELKQWSRSVDRHLQELVKDGTLEKLSGGLYYVPAPSTFGKVPAEEHKLVEAFLKDNHFLLTTPSDYNALGVGTTQGAGWSDDGSADFESSTAGGRMDNGPSS